MKKIILFICFSFFFLPFSSSAKNFVGLGLEYSMPMADWEEMNGDGLGFSFQIESRKYCQFWYGIKMSLVEYDTIPDNKNYFDQAMTISPSFKYNLMPETCYGGKIQPFLMAMLHISSIRSKNESTSKLGLGAGLGAGVAFPFKFMSYCWSIDFQAMYSAKNFILKDSQRPSLNSINAGVSLNMTF